MSNSGVGPYSTIMAELGNTIKKDDARKLEETSGVGIDGTPNLANPDHTHRNTANTSGPPAHQEGDYELSVCPEPEMSNHHTVAGYGPSPAPDNVVSCERGEGTLIPPIYPEESATNMRSSCQFAHSPYSEVASTQVNTSSTHHQMLEPYAAICTTSGKRLRRQDQSFRQPYVIHGLEDISDDEDDYREALAKKQKYYDNFVVNDSNREWIDALVHIGKSKNTQSTSSIKKRPTD